MRMASCASSSPLTRVFQQGWSFLTVSFNDPLALSTVPAPHPHMLPDVVLSAPITGAVFRVLLHDYHCW